VSPEQVRRTAAAALFWSQECRRDRDTILGCVAGMSDGERAEVAALIMSGELSSLTDDELRAEMAALAGVKSASPGVT
jgi:hypothetical protein